MSRFVKSMPERNSCDCPCAIADNDMDAKATIGIIFLIFIVLKFSINELVIYYLIIYKEVCYPFARASSSSDSFSQFSTSLSRVFFVDVYSVTYSIFEAFSG